MTAPLRHHMSDPIGGLALCGLDLADPNARTSGVDHVDFLDERVDGPRCPTCAIACAGSLSLSIVSCGVDSCQRPAIGWRKLGDEQVSACRTHLDPALGAIGGK